MLLRPEKNMSYQAIRGHGRNLSIFLSERSWFEMVTYYMNQTIWHSRKGKIVEKVKKISGCQGVLGMMDREEGISQAGNHSVWYYYSGCICQSP